MSAKKKKMSKISYSVVDAFKPKPYKYYTRRDKIIFSWVAVSGTVTREYENGSKRYKFARVACAPGEWHDTWHECWEAAKEAHINFTPDRIFFRVEPCPRVKEVGLEGDTFGLPDRELLLEVPIVLPSQADIDEGNFMQWRSWFVGCDDAAVRGGIRRKRNLASIRDCLLDAKDNAWAERDQFITQFRQVKAKLQRLERVKNWEEGERIDKAIEMTAEDVDETDGGGKEMGTEEEEGGGTATATAMDDSDSGSEEMTGSEKTAKIPPWEKKEDLFALGRKM